MPKSHLPITAPLRGALFECFQAATHLVRPEQRRQLVLVGGAAPSSVLIQIWEGVQNGAQNFTFESDGKIVFDAPQGFRVHLDIIEIGSGCIEQIHVTEPFFEGSVASRSDLLRLRAVTVVDRVSDGEMDDFRWLLSEVVRTGQFLPRLNA